jgi:hypothetical protein
MQILILLAGGALALLVYLGAFEMSKIVDRMAEVEASIATERAEVRGALDAMQGEIDLLKTQVGEGAVSVAEVIAFCGRITGQIQSIYTAPEPPPVEGESEPVE